MFSLHETTKRRVCRVLFLLCAVVPAAVTLTWITYSHRPWLEADWQRTLSQQLHVRVAVEHVASPRPGEVRLKHVRVADLRSERPLGSLDLVRAEWRGSQLTLAADQLTVEASHLSAWAATVSTCLSASELPAARLQIERLAIVGQEQNSLELSRVRLQSENDDQHGGRLSVQADFSGTGQGGAPPTVRLLVKQHGKTTTCTLDTGGAQLPTWVLADLMPSAARCAEATYSGSVRLRSESAAMSGSLHGRFENLELGQWIGSVSPHDVQAIGRVELDQFQWHGERVEVAHGNLQAGRGTVSHSLLADFQQRLFCVPGPGSANRSVAAAEPLAFDEVSCGFHMTTAGLTLTGRCRTIRDGAPGCLLASEGKPLLLEPRYANLPVAQLVQVLSQPAASWLPASREAHEMAGTLPLPRVGPQPSEEMATQPKESTAR